MAELQPILDHLVILVPHETLLNLPPWLPQAFTILGGGRHADGVTENKLILFQDGVYLELIAFIPGKEQERASHRWGHRREGHIVDWANTLHSLPDLAAIRDRVASAGSGITYSDPVSGGRVRPDGTELKWTISAPQIDAPEAGGAAAAAAAMGEFEGGEAPFWCLDRTPRELRVPHKVRSNVEHPSGAVGVAGVRVSVRDVRVFETLRKTYDALQGREGWRLVTEGGGGDATGASAYAWDLLVPETAGGDSAQRSLVLAHVAEGSHGGSPDVYVSIDLVGASEGSVSGHLGDESWAIDFRLKA